MNKPLSDYLKNTAITVSIVLSVIQSGFAAEKVDKAALVAAKAAVKEILKDPESVKFKDIRSNSVGDICGVYNAKNSYGGYGEPEYFMYVKKTKELLNLQVMRLQREFDAVKRSGEDDTYHSNEYWATLKSKAIEQNAIELRIAGCTVVAPQ